MKRTILRFTSYTASHYLERRFFTVLGNLCSIDYIELYTARKFKVGELDDFAGCLKSVWCSVIGDFRQIVKWANDRFVKIHFSLTQKTYLLLIIRHDRLRRLANMSFRWHRANIWTFCLQSIVICKQFFSALSPYMTLNKTFQFHLFHIPWYFVAEDIPYELFIIL